MENDKRPYFFRREAERASLLERRAYLRHVSRLVRDRFNRFQNGDMPEVVLHTLDFVPGSKNVSDSLRVEIPGSSETIGYSEVLTPLNRILAREGLPENGDSVSPTVPYRNTEELRMFREEHPGEKLGLSLTWVALDSPRDEVSYLFRERYIDPEGQALSEVWVARRLFA